MKIGVPELLFLIFVACKLTGYINWSWWWITSPLWIMLLLAMLIAFVEGAVNSKNTR